MFYTYLWLREDGTPYYVGKGKGDRGFVNGSHRQHCPPVDRIVVNYWTDEETAFAYETYLIDFYGRIDLGTGCLRNLTDGGEGTTGKSEDAIRRIRESMLGNTRGKGQEFSEKRRERLREVSKGNTKGKANKGRKRGHPWNFGTRIPEEEAIKRHRAAGKRYRDKKTQLNLNQPEKLERGLGTPGGNSKVAKKS